MSRLSVDSVHLNPTVYFLTNLSGGQFSTVFFLNTLPSYIACAWVLSPLPGLHGDLAHLCILVLACSPFSGFLILIPSMPVASNDMHVDICSHSCQAHLFLSCQFLCPTFYISLESCYDRHSINIIHLLLTT